MVSGMAIWRQYGTSIRLSCNFVCADLAYWCDIITVAVSPSTINGAAISIEKRVLYMHTWLPNVLLISEGRQPLNFPSSWMLRAENSTAGVVTSRGSINDPIQNTSNMVTYYIMVSRALVVAKEVFCHGNRDNMTLWDRLNDENNVNSSILFTWVHCAFLANVNWWAKRALLKTLTLYIIWIWEFIR